MRWGIHALVLWGGPRERKRRGWARGAKAGSPCTSTSGLEPQALQVKPGLPGCYKVVFVKVANRIYTISTSLV